MELGIIIEKKEKINTEKYDFPVLTVAADPISRDAKNYKIEFNKSRIFNETCDRPGNDFRARCF